MRKILDQTIHAVGGHALIHDSVRDENPRPVARAEWIEDRAGAHRRLLTPHHGDIQPRAFALAEDDVEQLERRGVDVTMLGNAEDPQSDYPCGWRTRPDSRFRTRRKPPARCASRMD